MVESGFSPNFRFYNPIAVLSFAKPSCGSSIVNLVS